VLVNRTLPLVRVLVLSGVGTMTATNVVDPPPASADVVVTVLAGNVPDVIVTVASCVGTPTRAYVIVEAARKPPVVVTMVEVKPVPGAPMKVVKEVDSTGAGVGTLTRTYVIVEAPAPRRPPVVVTIVDVNPIEP
jgi:hypothetical protein